MPTNEIYQAGNYEIHQLDIVSEEGTVDVTELLVEMNFYEDLFYPITTGDLLLNDTFNLLSNLPLREGDILKIHLKAGLSDKEMLNALKKEEMAVMMEIVQVQKRQVLKQDQQVYLLRLTSTGLSNNVRTRISRGYKQKRYSDVVKEIFDDKLTLGTIHYDDDSSYKDNKLFVPKKLVTEATEGTFSFVLPRWKPLRCIEWLSNRSRKGKACNFVFFETLEGFYFKSIESLIDGEPVFTYTPDVSTGDKNDIRAYFNISQYKYEDTGDVLGASVDGMLGNRMLSYDFLTKNMTDYFSQGSSVGQYKNDNPFSYNDDFESLTHCDDDGSPLIDSWTVDTFATEPGNSRLTVIPVHTDAWESTSSYKPELYLRQRMSQMETWQYLNVTCEVIGNYYLTVGMKVALNLPSPQWQGKGVKLDSKFAGNYLVTQLRRRFTKSDFSMTLTCAKDNLYSVQADHIWES